MLSHLHLLITLSFLSLYNLIKNKKKIRRICRMQRPVIVHTNYRTHMGMWPLILPHYVYSWRAEVFTGWNEWGLDLIENAVIQIVADWALHIGKNNFLVPQKALTTNGSEQAVSRNACITHSLSITMLGII